MKIKKLLILTLLAVLVGSCGQKQLPQVSIDSCYQLNLKDSTLMTGWYYVADSGFVRVEETTGESFALNPCPIVTAEDIIELKVTENRWKDSMLTMQFGERGTQAWAIATEKAIGNKLAFILNDDLLCVSVVQSRITGGISTVFGHKPLRKLLNNRLIHRRK